MDDIKDPTGKDPVFDTTVPTPRTDDLKEVGAESERRGGHEAEPED